MAVAGVDTADLVSLDASLWSSFANARGDRDRLTSWLSLLVGRIPAAVMGAVLEADHAEGAFVPRAVVPDPRADASGLRDVAERALRSGRPAVAEDPDGAPVARLAYPVRVGDAPVDTVVALELRTTDKAALQTVMRDVHWASGWLESRAWARTADRQAGQVRRAAAALDLMAVCGEHRRPRPAAMAVVNELQTTLDADQVSIGWARGRGGAQQMRLLTISHSAFFKRRSASAEALEMAMEECFDQAQSVACPPLPGTERAIAVAHGDRIADGRSAHMISVPLFGAKGPVGVLTCERRDAARPFDEEGLKMAEAAASLLGPVLDGKMSEARWFGGRLIDGVIHAIKVVLGPRRVSWKLLTLLIVALVTAGIVVERPFRVQGDAVLRGTVQLAVVAPMNGYVADAPLRAGDPVSEGDMLARLDERDLRLEELRWSSEVDRLRAQERAAAARAERAEAAFLNAQVRQAEAQLRLVHAQLERVILSAPIDGVIVNGDLSQQIGAPVSIGDVLFEVAPLDRFRVDIFADERDLRYVSLGQEGQIVLAARPEELVPFEVDRITPVAEPREGRNTFRVEGTVGIPLGDLRPGMEGVAKIDVGQANLVWIWSRRFIDWVRETAWTWQP